MEFVLLRKPVLLWAVCVIALVKVVCAQTPQQTPTTQSGEVVRINTNLVQTDVMVFDKQGRFVDGLQRDQFELIIDGKSQPIAFFEQVRAGSSKEAQLTSADNTNRTPLAQTSASAAESRGRTIVFFIDDLHLSLDSLGRTRKMLTQFIENEMNLNDQVAIASTSGGIGFLQQFANNKPMLRAAVSRLIQRPYDVHGVGRETMPMTEYIALAIERKESSDLVRFYVEECLKAAPPRYPPISCEVEVINRARSILSEAASVTSNTYASLESLMRSTAQVPGRKLVFFVSDGFLLDTGPRNSDPRTALTRITDAALRTGVVIYTIDARGLTAGQADATNNLPFDANGRLQEELLRAIPASQDALNALAADTGGRALRNQNRFEGFVGTILEETSNYYRVSWRPNNQEQTSSDFQSISVRVTGHPEFSIRLPRGFLRMNTSKVTDKPTNKDNSPLGELRRALGAFSPRRDVPLSLSAIYLDTPDHGLVLTASTQLSNAALTYEAVGDKQIAAVDLIGIVLDDKGKQVGSFQTRLKINASENSTSTIYNHRLPLAPGLYQLRVAARDSKGGQVGSAQEWIEIPDLSSRRLSLSSLVLGLADVKAVEAKSTDGATSQVQVSVDHRFARDSKLRYLTFIYNGVRGQNSPPDISIQARILRAGKTIFVTPLDRIKVESKDFARIPYAGEIALSSVPSGQYTLEVTVTDQISKTTTSQQTKIIVE